MALPKLYSVASTPGLFRTTTRHTPTSVYYGRIQIKDPKASDPKKRKRSFTKKFGVFVSAEAAADILRGFRREIRAEFGKDAPPPSSTIKTLRDAQSAHLIEKIPRLRPNTVKNYKREDETAIAFFGYPWTVRTDDPEIDEERAARDCLLSEITRRRIEEWIRFRLDTCEPATVNRDLARLRSVMRWAEREGWLEGGNPMNQVRQLRELEGRINWLDEDDEQKLKEASPDWLWRMIEFSIMTGLRRGEQLSLRWDQLRKDKIEVLAAESKSLRPRWVPIQETVTQILEEQRNDPKAHPVWVFPNRSGKNRWNPYNLFKAFDKARIEAGLKNYRWHDNRHTFCSRLVQEGTPLEKVQLLAGHRNLKTTQRYAHLSPTHLIAPMEALEKRKRRVELGTKKEQPTGATQGTGS